MLTEDAVTEDIACCSLEAEHGREHRMEKGVEMQPSTSGPLPNPGTRWGCGAEGARDM